MILSTGGGVWLADQTMVATGKLSACASPVTTRPSAG